MRPGAQTLLRARRGLGACLLALLAMPAMALEARVTVKPEQLGLAVNPAVTRGFNFGNWMAVSENRDALARVPAASLRFPGGNIGDEQDMDEATLNTLVSLLTLVKGQPEMVIQTRVFGGRVDRIPANTPQDAAHAVRMAGARGLKVAFWEIGNEPDLFSTVRVDPSWTAERYCDVFRAQAAAIKAADPKARVAGPAVSAATGTSMEFMERFVHLCGDVVDMVTWHIYPTDGSGNEEAALATVAQIGASIDHVRSLWSDPVRNPLGYKRVVKQGITEFGLSWRTDRPRFLADQTAALWAAEATLRLAQSGVDTAHYFAYQGTGFHGLLDNGGVPRPTYYAFRMLGQLQGRFVPSDASDARLWSHAARDGDQLRLLLLNTSSEAMQVQLEAADWKAREAQFFDAAMVEDEQPPASLPAQPQLTLPARSMASILLVRSQP